MKKLIALALVAVMAMSLAGCCCCLPINKCDLCGEIGMHPERTTKYTQEEHPVCDDCYYKYSFLFR